MKSLGKVTPLTLPEGGECKFSVNKKEKEHERIGAKVPNAPNHRQAPPCCVAEKYGGGTLITKETEGKLKQPEEDEIDTKFEDTKRKKQKDDHATNLQEGDCKVLALKESNTIKRDRCRI